MVKRRLNLICMGGGKNKICMEVNNTSETF